MTTITLTEARNPYTLRCQHCKNTIDAIRPCSSLDTARAAGWRIWEGKTIGGRHERHVICRTCIGPAEEQAPDAPSWDAECKTCDARASEEWDDEEPLPKESAEEWMRDHECEPWTELIEPKKRAET